MSSPNDMLASVIAEALAKALLPQLSAFVSAQTNIQQELAELNEGIALGSHYIRRIAVAAEALAAGEQDPNDAPDIEMPLETFAGFDWSSISAEVVARDEFGPSILSFGGKAFKRRSPDNAFDPAVWFSRCVGKDEAGKNQYVRLITFRPMSDKVEPMGRKVERAVAQAAAAHPQPAQPKEVTPPQPATAQPNASAPAPVTPQAGAQSDADFDRLPPAPRVSPPPRPAEQPGPRVSAGAAPDAEPAKPQPVANHTDHDVVCELCGLDHAGDESNVKRQATLSLPGAAGARWRDWVKDFAHRFPHYRLGRGDDVDMYHVLLTAAHLRRPNITIDNLDEVTARLERYAAGHHPA